MRLFLLLSALLASLTGLLAGEPTQARAGEPAAITAAVNSGAEQRHETIIVLRRPAARAPGKEGQAVRVADQVAPSQLHAVDERRIE